MAIDTPSHARDISHELSEIEAVLADNELPQWVFNDPAYYDLELETIFATSWILIGHESEIPAPGDYARRFIGNDPYIFVRDDSGDYHVFFASCRHRGMQVCRSDSGNTSHFRCPYHGWTYSNDGQLTGVPLKDQDFNSLHGEEDEWGLLEAPRVDSYKGLVFASLAEDGPGLREFLGGAKWYLDLFFDLTEGGMQVIGEPWRWECEFDWKMAMTNFIGDGYHTQASHQSIFEVGLKDQKYSATQHAHIMNRGHGGLLRLAEADDEVYFGYPDTVIENLNPNLSDGQQEVARRGLLITQALWPNVHMDLAPGTTAPENPAGTQMTLATMRPIGPNKTELIRWTFAPNEMSEADKSKLHKVSLEAFGPTGGFETDDVEIFEQISAASRATSARMNRLNARLGFDESDTVDRIEDWVGPGAVYDGYTDIPPLTFMEMWKDHVRQGVEGA